MPQQKKYQDPFAPRITHDSVHTSRFVCFILTMELCGEGQDMEL